MGSVLVVLGVVALALLGGGSRRRTTSRRDQGDQGDQGGQGGQGDQGDGRRGDAEALARRFAELERRIREAEEGSEARTRLERELFDLETEVQRLRSQHARQNDRETTDAQREYDETAQDRAEWARRNPGVSPQAQPPRPEAGVELDASPSIVGLRDEFGRELSPAERDRVIAARELEGMVVDRVYRPSGELRERLREHQRTLGLDPDGVLGTDTRAVIAHELVTGPAQSSDTTGDRDAYTLALYARRLATAADLARVQGRRADLRSDMARRLQGAVGLPTTGRWDTATWAAVDRLTRGPRDGGPAILEWRERVYARDGRPL